MLQAFWRGFFGVDQPHELFKGVTKPTTTVTHMLIAEMFQNVGKVTMYETGYYPSKFPSFEIRLDYQLKSNVRKYYVAHLAVPNHPDLEFDERERKLFLHAALEFLKLQEKHKKMNEVGKVQQAAVDFIASITKPEPENAVENG